MKTYIELYEAVLRHTIEELYSFIQCLFYYAIILTSSVLYKYVFYIYSGENHVFLNLFQMDIILWCIWRFHTPILLSIDVLPRKHFFAIFWSNILSLLGPRTNNYKKDIRKCYPTKSLYYIYVISHKNWSSLSTMIKRYTNLNYYYYY